MSCEKHGYTNNVLCPACDLETIEANRTSNDQFKRASRGWLIECKVRSVPAWWNGMRFDLLDNKAWDFESAKAIVFADWASASATLNNLRVETMQRSEKRGPYALMERMQLSPTEHEWPSPVETISTLMVDGVRHHSACACLHTPAGECARRPCSCGASSKI